ncbi:uncharacterized protein A1O5_02928 [Cladophialophora psammophila CBS 110553]|uniref:ABC-2 type transporter domain-containing protein n=1 Tax=Cladophialophora psammophila CBS 110553 TaxID=1182543 RepID=W9XCG4_9EURO|nr:uncharacterized protein A1O5_02928 [Cladophialophora psammophila CBS 110553]EXJ74631.1 hypothetical protein A1O5_02928 [Cladophialophora psammophila CBS 110553]
MSAFGGFDFGAAVRAYCNDVMEANAPQVGLLRTFVRAVSSSQAPMEREISTASSTEEDYQEIYEAAIHDRLRDGLETLAERKKPKRHHRYLHVKQQDPELTTIATRISNDMRIAPKSLADIVPPETLKMRNSIFDSWASTFVQMVREDGIKRSNIGVCFKSLTVCGTGSSLALQPTAASPWLDLARLLMFVTRCKPEPRVNQSIFDVFNKVMVLQTPDFLTSITSPWERQPRPKYADTIPRTPIEFEQYWLKSEDYHACTAEITRCQENAKENGRLEALRATHHAAQAHHTRAKSPFLLSVWMQIRLRMKRSSQLLWNDRNSTVTLAMRRIILALIVGSIYFNPPDTTASLHSRGVVIFLATLLNALMAITEIAALFAKSGIVRKQNSFAFYHPFAGGFGAFIVNIPVKFVISILFDVIYYFLSRLRPDTSSFFTFPLFNFVGILVMSTMFRSIGASSKQLPQAYAISGITVLMMVIYTGFILQTAYIHP